MSFWKKVEEIGKKATEVAAELGTEGQKRLTEYQQKAEEQRKVTEAELAARQTEQDALLAQHVPGVVKFNVAANYHGGYPGFPDIIDGGHLYLSQDELVWLKLPTVVRIPYTDIYDLDLDNFKVSMMRSFLAGGSDNDVHRLKNTLVVICRINGVKQRVKFEVWGGLSVHAGALNAQKAVDHMAEVRHLFAQEQAPTPFPSSAPATTFSIADELERLAQMRERGLLDDEEFKAFKAKLLAKL
ncbi:hypothetical protein L1280_001522 [Deinococcus sp. HSC-46F16]|uniref:SHOCT domain-containing protein n=1 Tax=Deinococcus sp. HSC-46F16 TaxID=2910968 RepID=UPI0020A1BEA4|nr:hypothetical protein [Deinococcus sp. HSC-46F16]MCP2014385.1 hypothetical protein [Deinococcus sp. HSC-46F16]